MPKNSLTNKDRFAFEDLCKIVALLRSPEGCPWDREQTHESLRNNFVEEAYEVCEGIDRKDDALLCEELGDVLLQIVFHAEIAKDEGAFLLSDVIDGIAKKMIKRHPHVFGDATVQPDWEEIKRQEKGETGLKDTLERISTSLPALKRAEKFIKKGAPTPSSCESALLETGKDFYELCKKSRAAGIDPEEALNAYLKKITSECTNCE